jgi:hypothetical protein
MTDYIYGYTIRVKSQYGFSSVAYPPKIQQSISEAKKKQPSLSTIIVFVGTIKEHVINLATGIIIIVDTRISIFPPVRSLKSKLTENGSLYCSLGYVAIGYGNFVYHRTFTNTEENIIKYAISTGKSSVKLNGHCCVDVINLSSRVIKQHSTDPLVAKKKYFLGEGPAFNAFGYRKSNYDFGQNNFDLTQQISNKEKRYSIENQVKIMNALKDDVLTLSFLQATPTSKNCGVYTDLQHTITFEKTDISLGEKQIMISVEEGNITNIFCLTHYNKFFSSSDLGDIKCGICFANIVNRVIGCNHKFCNICIENMRESISCSFDCPYCREPILSIQPL